MKKITALFTLLFTATLGATAAVLPAEKLLPDDTLVVISVPDFMKAREVYQNSPQGRFWSDPSMKPFADKFMGKLQADYLTPLEHDLGVHFTDYTNLLQGQVTLALDQNGWQGKDKDANQPAMLFLLDTKGKSSQLTTNLADLKKKWVDAGKTARTEKIRDVEFNVIVISTNDIPKTLKKKPVSAADAPEPMDDPEAKNAPKKQIYIGQKDSLLIIGSSPKPIEKVLAAMSGGTVRVLGDQAAFSGSAAMFHDAPIYGWVNAKSFVDAFIHADDGADSNAPNPLGFSPAKLLTAMGFGGLKTFAFNYLYSPDGAQFNFMIGVPEAERTGLFKILAGEAKDCNPPRFVPADVVKFQRWRISGQKAWDTLHKITTDMSPGSAGGIDFMLSSAETAAKEKDPAFDIKKYLFGNLGDDYITYQKNPKGTTFADLGSPPSLFLIGSPNPEQLGSALKTLASSFYQAPTEREFLGHKIVSFPVPAPPSATKGKSQNNSIGYTCNSGYVAISSDPGMLEEFLRSSTTEGKSLRDTPGLAEATQKVGGSGISLLGFSNEGEGMRVFLDTLKGDSSISDPMASLNTMAMAFGLGGSDTKLKDWFDVSLLPSYDKISKYFYISVYAGEATPDGLRFKGFGPTPPGLKKELAATPAPAPAPKPQ